MPQRRPRLLLGLLGLHSKQKSSIFQTNVRVAVLEVGGGKEGGLDFVSRLCFGPSILATC